MLHAGLLPSFVAGHAAYLVAQSLADARLALGQGAIIDAVNAEEEDRDLWRAAAACTLRVDATQSLHDNLERVLSWLAVDGEPPVR